MNQPPKKFSHRFDGVVMALLAAIAFFIANAAALFVFVWKLLTEGNPCPPPV